MARIVKEATKRHPTIYQLYDNGEHLMLGSDVGLCMGYYKGNLYKRYPSLWRKVLSSEERERMGELNLDNRCLSNMGTMFVRASEAMEVLDGNGDAYRKKNTVVADQNNQNKEAINAAFRRRHSRNVDRTTIENMTYSPSARLKNDERNKDNWQKLRSRVHTIATKPCPIAVSIVDESPAVAVMNSVTMDTIASPRRGRKRANETKATKEIVVKDLWPTWKLYDDSDIEAVHQAAKEVEELIPIRLDLELEGKKLRDTFTWNKNEKLITLEAFAELLCDDLDLPCTTFIPVIVETMRTQIKQHEISDDDQEYYARRSSDDSSTDQRVIIRLNLHVGNVSLQDQFEWDMSEPLNNPEQFATSICTELGLGGEFITAIAYSIRGQLNWNKKTRAHLEKRLATVTRRMSCRSGPDVERWCPELDVLTDQEMERKLKDQDRNTRRIRRLANSAPYSLQI